jgi:queuine/archaeosine tRNA-ribosyltransferase
VPHVQPSLPSPSRGEWRIAFGGLNTVHNLRFYLNLVGEMRRALEEGEFPEYTSRRLLELSEESAGTQ